MSVKIDTLIKLLPWLVANPGRTAREIAAEFGIRPDDVLDAVQLLVVTGPNPREGGGCVDIDFYAPDDDLDSDDDVKRDFDVAITVIDPQNLDRPIRLDPLSAASIIVGLNFIQSLPGVIEPTFIQTLLEKIQFSSGVAEAPVAVMPHGEIESAVLKIRDAINRAVCLHIEYASGSTERISSRVIEPKAVLTRDDIVYVRAYCQQAEDTRTFRVDRIMTLLEVEEPQSHHADVLEDRITAPLDISVKLRVAREFLYDFNQSLRTDPEEIADGRLEIVTAVGSIDWLVSQVFASAGGIEVVEPLDLRQHIADLARSWSLN